MLIHLSSDNPKSIEQKVQELIIKKLYIKVDDELILIDKEDSINLILLDIISIACCDYDLEKAVLFRQKIQEEYNKPKELILEDFNDIAAIFEVEIEAYKFYFNAAENEFSEDDVYDEVLSILNSEHNLLEKKLHELMITAIKPKVPENETSAKGFDRNVLLNSFAEKVRLIAASDNLEDAVETAYYEYDEKVEKEWLRKEFSRITPLLKEEINTYKMALSMEAQNAEFSMILAMVKELLQIEP